MNKKESKYFSTAHLMDEALIYLLDKKEIEYITIKEICEEAGVNRSTFYLHYENINDLLEETLKYINHKFIDCFNEDTQEFIRKINELPLEELNLINEKYLIPYLNFVKENKKIFRASFNNPNTLRVHDKYKDLEKYILSPILERFCIQKEERRYLMTFYVHGITAIIEEWLKNDCDTDISKIKNIIIKCVKTSTIN